MYIYISNIYIYVYIYIKYIKNIFVFVYIKNIFVGLPVSFQKTCEALLESPRSASITTWHMPAYVSIRQHTSEYVSIRKYHRPQACRK